MSIAIFVMEPSRGSEGQRTKILCAPSSQIVSELRKDKVNKLVIRYPKACRHLQDLQPPKSTLSESHLKGILESVCRQARQKGEGQDA